VQSRVIVVTDSVACLPPALAERHGIRVVPVRLLHRGQSYRDGVDITPARTWELLTEKGVRPTTAAPPPGDFVSVFQHLDHGRADVFVVTVALGFSRVYNSALTALQVAREELPGLNIEVFDSGTAAGAEGLIALAAARAAAAGNPLPEVARAARSIASRTYLYAVLDDLRWLAKGGHVPEVAAWMGSALRIKPVLRALPLAGKASLVRKVNGRRRALEALLEETERVSGGKPIRASIMHTGALTEAQELRARLDNQVECVESWVTDFTPVMGVHTGPGLVGLAFHTV
jgi:DegV family protein with EDD domain